MTQAPNWYADPFGRFELRFFDGSAWTPYVKCGEEHAVDEPADGAAAMAPPVSGTPATGPVSKPSANLLLDDLPVLSLVAPAAGMTTSAAIFDETGTRVGEVRRGLPVRRRPTFEIVDKQGMLVASLRRPDKGDKKHTFSVVDGAGTAMGCIRKDSVRGATAFGLEGPAELLGFLRVGAGDDFRIEDRLGRTMAAGRRTGTSRVLEVEATTAARLRPMLMVAALAFDVALA